MTTFPHHTDNADARAVIDIANILKDAGGRALLVGGCVRDAFLDKENKDLDVEVYGLSPEQIKRLVGRRYPLDFVGQSFGVFKVRHHDIDIALPRTESKTAPGHKGFDVVPDPNLSFSEAAARRDFTINAMMLDPLTDELIDPWHGREDLANGILRHVSEHFAEDPLRVLRAMQFAARFGFTVATETIELCKTLRQEELPMERLETEWEKLLLKGRTPSKGLDFLRACGWIRYYPELQHLVGCQQNPEWHPEGDVWTHTCIALDEAARRRPENMDDARIFMLAVLCHDFGKPATSVFDTVKQAITSKGHEIAGERPTRSFISRIWNRADLADNVVALVSNHMHPTFLVMNNATDKAYRRLSLSAKRLDLLYLVCVSDIVATLPGEDRAEQRIGRMDEFLRHAQSLSIDNQPPKPILLGRHLIQHGVTPGPRMGEILKTCFDAQIDGAFTDLDSGLIYLENLLNNTGENK